MAKNIEMQQKTSSGYEVIYPRTLINNVVTQDGKNLQNIIDGEIGDIKLSANKLTREDSNWIKCDGQDIEYLKYPTLYKKIEDLDFTKINKKDNRWVYVSTLNNGKTRTNYGRFYGKCGNYYIAFYSSTNEYGRLDDCQVIWYSESFYGPYQTKVTHFGDVGNVNFIYADNTYVLYCSINDTLHYYTLTDLNTDNWVSHTIPYPYSCSMEDLYYSGYNHIWFQAIHDGEHRKHKIYRFNFNLVSGGEISIASQYEVLNNKNPIFFLGHSTKYFYFFTEGSIEIYNNDFARQTGISISTYSDPVSGVIRDNTLYYVCRETSNQSGSDIYAINCDTNAVSEYAKIPVRYNYISSYGTDGFLLSYENHRAVGIYKNQKYEEFSYDVSDMVGVDWDTHVVFDDDSKSFILQCNGNYPIGYTSAKRIDIDYGYIKVR